MKALLNSKSKTRFWLVVVSDVFMLGCIPIFIEDVGTGVAMAVVLAGAAVWHSAANWPSK